MPIRMLEKLWNRLGRATLRHEPAAIRTREGRGLTDSRHLVFLVPATKSLHRAQPRKLVAHLSVRQDMPDWTCVVDTGWTRKAHAKSRAQRIKKMEGAVDLPPDFPQDPRIHLFWRDDVSQQGLPKELPAPLKEGDTLIYLHRGGDALVMESLLKRSTLPFKVGPTQQEPELDFMLTWPEGGDMSSFVQLTLHYLNTLDLK